MFRVIFDFLLGLMLAVLIVFIVFPPDQMPFSEQDRQAFIKLAQTAASVALLVGTAIFAPHWIALFKRIGKRLPAWMTKSLF